MTSKDLRRSQVVVPFGVGSTYDYLNYPGMTMAVDRWNLSHDQVKKLSIRNNRFVDHINHILRNLYEGPTSRRISYLIQPPIAKDLFADESERVAHGVIEVTKFPQWGICMTCNALAKFDPQNWKTTKCRNPESPAWRGGRKCSDKARGSNVEPVRFVGICPKGHIQDLPWVNLMKMACDETCNLHQEQHSFVNPSLYFRDDGYGRGFTSINITCGKCKKYKNLGGSGKAQDSANFVDIGGEKILSCSGQKPWIPSQEDCSLELTVQPRGATPIYQPIQRSAIYIPEPESIRHPLLSEDFVKNWIDENRGEEELTILVEGIGLDSKYSLTVQDVVNLIIEEKQNSDYEVDNLEETLIEANFYHQEYETLCKERVKEENFVSKSIPLSEYSPIFSSLFSSLHQVKTLRSCTALLGFTRGGVSKEQLSIEETFNPARESVNYLPAFEVIGEGFFINFGIDKIFSWVEKNKDFLEKLEIIKINGKDDYMRATYDETKLHPGFFMIHTFAHAIMRQLSIECGYGLTEIKERIYFNEKLKMAGLLIYTASSDSQGSLGGLVRMIKPQHFENLIINAMENIQTCSNDPICLESNGQGHSGLNLAACHACCMVPDLACSTLPKNIFLDRSVLVGNQENAKGYFLDIED